MFKKKKLKKEIAKITKFHATNFQRSHPNEFIIYISLDSKTNVIKIQSREIMVDWTKERFGWPQVNNEEKTYKLYWKQIK